MKTKFLKIKSLRTKLVTAILIAALLSIALTYGILNLFAAYSDVYSKEYVNKNRMKSVTYCQQFQKYVNKNKLKSADTSAIKMWAQRNPDISMVVYREDSTIYNSFYPKNPTSFLESLDTSAYATYKIKFTDRRAVMLVYGSYNYRVYAVIQSIIILFGVLLFLSFVVFFINQEIQRISRLRDEIGILQTGNLDYPITIEGKDELAALANGLDGMRLSLRNQFQVERDLLKANQNMVTSMSHDIRTPLTSILLYAEILKTRRWKTDEELMMYINKIDERTHVLKERTDNLFEYAIVSKNQDEKIAMTIPATARAHLFDRLSDFSASLQACGFSSTPEFNWDENLIQVNNQYVSRIMDNILSNIQKYADPSEPVIIRVKSAGSQVVLTISNKILEKPNASGTGIGLKNIDAMMAQMNGSCLTNEHDGVFRIALAFPRAGTIQ